MQKIIIAFFIILSLLMMGCSEENTKKEKIIDRTPPKISKISNSIEENILHLNIKGEPQSILIINNEIYGELNSNGEGIFNYFIDAKDINVSLEDMYGNRSEPIIINLDINSTINDTIPPSIKLLGDETIIIINGKSFKDPGIDVSDNVTNQSDIKITKEGYVDSNKVGTYTIKYMAIDEAGNISSISRVVIVKASNTINHPPKYNGKLKDIALKDAQSVELELKDAFSDEDNDSLSYTVTNLPSGLSLNGSKIVGRLKSDASVDSPYNIEVVVKDTSGKSATGRFKIIIENIAPIAKDDNVTLNEDSNITIDILSNDIDEDSDSISIKSIITQSQHGLAKVLNNKIIYKPNKGYSGKDSFKYQVEDAQGAVSEAIVNINIIHVNHPPKYNGSLKDIALKDAQSVELELKDAFSDEDNDSLSYTVTNLPSGLSLNGSKIVGRLKSDASVDSPYNIEVVVKDTSGKSATGRFKIIVSESLITANSDTIKTIKNRGINFYPYKNDIAKNKLDLSSESIIKAPTKGRVLIDFNGTFIYIPDSNTTGVDILTYKICDNQSPTNCDSANINITIEDINDTNEVKTIWGFVPFDIPDNEIVVETTDNIQSKIDQLKNLGGGKLIFKEGVYNTNNLSIPYNIILEGSGLGKTILKTDGNGFMMEARGEDASDRDENSASRNIIIKNMTIDCSNNGDYGCIEFNYGTYNVLIENIDIFGATKNNIIAWNEHWSKAGHFTIKNVISHDTKKWHGIALRFIKGAIVANNIVYKVHGEGIDMSRVDHGEVVNNSVIDTDYGIKFPGSTYIYLHDNLIDSVFVEGGIKFNPIDSTYNNEYFHLENNIVKHSHGGIIDWGDDAPTPHFAEFVSKNNIVTDDYNGMNMIRVANGKALYNYGDNVKDRDGGDPSDNFDIYKVRTKNDDPYIVDKVGYKSWPNLSTQ